MSSSFLLPRDSSRTERAMRPRKMAFFMRSASVSPRWGSRDLSRMLSTFFVLYSFA